MGFSIKDLFVKGAKELVEAIGNAIDKNVTSKEEKLKAKVEITELVTEFGASALDIHKEVILAEMNGNFYQRSWRPSLMYMAMAVIFSTWVVFPAINIWAQDQNITAFIGELKDADEFWGIIKLGVGAFGIGRTAEKIVKDTVNNIDVNLRRKK